MTSCWSVSMFFTTPLLSFFSLPSQTNISSALIPDNMTRSVFFYCNKSGNDEGVFLIHSSHHLEGVALLFVALGGKLRVWVAYMTD